MREFFAHARRAGFDTGVSATKLAQAMFETLLALPPDATPSKEMVVQRLGLRGLMPKTRDLDAAWNRAKRLAVCELPGLFHLKGQVLQRVTAMENRPPEKLSAAGHRKLAALVAREGLAPDELLSRLISSWRREKRAVPPRV